MSGILKSGIYFDKSKKIALLDTDFLSKLSNVQNSHRTFLSEILSIKDFQFVCHAQIQKEISQNTAKNAISIEEEEIEVITDYNLLSMLKETFGDMFSLFYISHLAKSCELFSDTLFDRCYSNLKELISKDGSVLNIESIMYAIELGDEKASIDNNLGEIKLLTTVNILRQVGFEDVFILCSDDRKARYIMSKEENIECVSVLSSFYIAKKYLNMTKETAQKYFDSLLEYYKRANQNSFRIRTDDGLFIKIEGQTILEMLYEDKLELMSDGYFKISSNRNI